MKRISCLLVVLLFAVATTKAQTPLRLNDDLTGITDSLYAYGQKWGTQFSKAYTDGNYSGLKTIAADMAAFISKKISFVQNMKDVNNSKPLRVAMLDFLAFEKQMTVDGFSPFESFNSSTTKEKIQAALDALTEKSKAEETILKKLAAAQEVYAKENGFKIAEKTGN